MRLSETTNVHGDQIQELLYELLFFETRWHGLRAIVVHVHAKYFDESLLSLIDRFWIVKTSILRIIKHDG